MEVDFKPLRFVGVQREISPTSSPHPPDGCKCSIAALPAWPTVTSLFQTQEKICASFWRRLFHCEKVRIYLFSIYIMFPNLEKINTSIFYLFPSNSCRLAMVSFSISL